VDLLRGGYLCKNFIIETHADRFFLKQYRHKLSQVVSQIKFAESFFASQGAPVLLPMSDGYGRSAFLMGQNWYSLFPFHNAQTKNLSELGSREVRLLGEQLAQLHRAGAGISDQIQPLLLWDKNRFDLEVVEIERALNRQPRLNRIEQMIKQMLEKKKRFVSNQDSCRGRTLPYDTLLHGDFGYQNVFFSEDGERIESIFDFEKTARGPRAYELARSLFVNCFEDGWEQKNIDLAVEFLTAYYKQYPLSLEEFQLGVCLYLTNLAHQTWVEGKVLLKKSLDYLDLLETHARRIDHLTDDIDALSVTIFQRATRTETATSLP